MFCAGTSDTRLASAQSSNLAVPRVVDKWSTARRGSAGWNQLGALAFKYVRFSFVRTPPPCNGRTACVLHRDFHILLVAPLAS